MVIAFSHFYHQSITIIHLILSFTTTLDKVIHASCLFYFNGFQANIPAFFLPFFQCTLNTEWSFHDMSENPPWFFISLRLKVKSLHGAWSPAYLNLYNLLTHSLFVHTTPAAQNSFFLCTWVRVSRIIYTPVPSLGLCLQATIVMKPDIPAYLQQEKKKKTPSVFPTFLLYRSQSKW